MDPPILEIVCQLHQMIPQFNFSMVFQGCLSINPGYKVGLELKEKRINTATKLVKTLMNKILRRKIFVFF